MSDQHIYVMQSTMVDVDEFRYQKIFSKSQIFFSNQSLEDIFLKNLPTAAALSLPRTDFLPSAPA